MKKLSKRNALVESTVLAFDACYGSCISLCRGNGTAQESTFQGIRNTRI